MTAPDKGLLERVARGISRPGGASPAGVTGSILAQAAKSYGARPIFDEATVPTGFDPAAAALFEATVEAAFLVANSDGVFDDDERAAFQSVVSAACNDQVQPVQLQVLRLAALMAHISGGVAESEQSVLEHLARGFDLEPGAVERALAEAES